MTENHQTPIEALQRLRHSIDNIDDALIHLLAERAKYGGQSRAIQLKLDRGSAQQPSLSGELRLVQSAEQAGFEAAFASRLWAILNAPEQGTGSETLNGMSRAL